MPSAAGHFLSLAHTALLAWTIANLLAALILAVLFVRRYREAGRLEQARTRARAGLQTTNADLKMHQLSETRAYRLLDHEQAQVRRLENLRTASANIVIEVSLSGLLKSITGNAAVLLDAERCEIVLFDPERQEAFPQSGGEETASPSIFDGNQVQQNILNTGRAVLLHPPSPLLPASQSPAFRSMLAVPLTIRKQTLGILAMGETCREAPFNPDDLQLLELFAQQSAIAIQNAELFEEVNRLAVTDGLTGIFNHRQVVGLALQELERSRRYTLPFSICMFDIDHFKQINDQYGHPTGDQVLRWLAQMCKNVIRFNDTIGRYGGEEFLVLLPNTPFSAGLQCAERLRQKVDEAVFQNEQHQLKITISLGVAAWTPETGTVEALLEAADKALYFSKQSGRNQVTGLDIAEEQFILYSTTSF